MQNWETDGLFVDLRTQGVSPSKIQIDQAFGLIILLLILVTLNSRYFIHLELHLLVTIGFARGSSFAEHLSHCEIVNSSFLSAIKSCRIVFNAAIRCFIFFAIN